GSEAINTNLALVDIINSTLGEVEGFPFGAINFIQSREDVRELLNFDKYVDLIIPRGASNRLTDAFRKAACSSVGACMLSRLQAVATHCRCLDQVFN
ncbi:MAG: hypothetical protein RR068_11990, partial [Hafnia sp.]